MEIKSRLKSYRKRRKDNLNYEPTVSVIIPTYNRKETLSLVLISLFQQNYPKDKYEVIVADDGSDDGTKEFIAKIIKSSPISLKYAYKPRAGFCPGQARNLGANEATGELLVFLDDDVVVLPNFIRSHVKAQIKAPVVLGYKSGYDSEDNHEIADFRAALVKKKKDIRSIPLIKEFRDNEFNDPLLKTSKTNPQIWQIFATGNNSIRKDIFLEFHFDESFVGWGDEDVELGYRLYKAGYQILLDKSCLGFHIHKDPHSKGAYTKEKLISLIGNMEKFYSKYLNKEIAQYINLRYHHLPLGLINDMDTEERLSFNKLVFHLKNTLRKDGFSFDARGAQSK